MDKRIKILYTIPNFDTAGSGKVVYDLVKHIDTRVFDPHICCMHTRGKYFKTVESLGVQIHVFQFAEDYHSFFSLPFRILKIRNFFKKHNFDIIHSWHWSSDITEPLAAKLANVPYIYTKKAMSWGNKAWKWRSYLSSKIVTINSDMVHEFFSGMLHKIVEIPIGLDENAFKILKKTYKNNDGISFNENDFVIISVVNLVEVKGIEILLDAVKMINNTRVKVLIVGDNSSDYAIQLMKTYANSQITFTGKKYNIEDYLSMADVFVIPTKNEGRREGQPIAPIEAMLYGRIVIGSNVAGIRDVLKDFPENLFEAGHSNALREKLEYIMSVSQEKGSDMVRKMRQFALNNYNITRSIESHEMLYKSIIKK